MFAESPRPESPVVSIDIRLSSEVGVIKADRLRDLEESIRAELDLGRAKILSLDMSEPPTSCIFDSAIANFSLLPTSHASTLAGELSLVEILELGVELCDL